MTSRTRSWLRVVHRAQQRETPALAVHRVGPRGEGDVAPVPGAAFPDSEADELHALQFATIEVQLGVGQLSGGASLVVRRDLDHHDATLQSGAARRDARLRS
jgi:hypothetical protein